MTAPLADQRARYRIRVQGRLEPVWATRLDGLTLTAHDIGGPTAVTDVTGWFSDQAALMGVLGQFYAHGLTLLRLERLRQDSDGD